MSEWRYDREFDIEVPRVSGHVRVAFQVVRAWSDDDPLARISGWIRLVLWTNSEGAQSAHVSVASNLGELLRIAFHTLSDPRTGEDFSLYLTDYENLKVETRDGRASLWTGTIEPPRTFLEYLDREERRRRLRKSSPPGPVVGRSF